MRWKLKQGNDEDYNKEKKWQKSDFDNSIRNDTERERMTLLSVPLNPVDVAVGAPNVEGVVDPNPPVLL